ncbi:NTP transferase domain-containing protein [Patescibacteria group bacterium]|nr:NTP transferase domain-containing protein [Patescibacteria group bacterium]MBU1895279.1 NTP transferase domain-containing protein [Patescibacteria group bacterium]
MLENKSNKIGIIILAAGHGTRMKSDIPKVMHQLGDKPLVAHVVDHAVESGCCEKPVVVVCTDHDQVQDYLGDRAVYAIQDKQLGTGHATLSAESLLRGQVDHIVVLYGDMPFVSAESIFRLVERHIERDNTITLMTVTVPNFEDTYAPFYRFGRVLRREEDSHIAGIVEFKDCNEEQKEIKEVNPSYFCFKADWMWNNLKKIKNNNSQDEYYLPDLLKMAIDTGETISSIDIEPKEARGINTKEDLEIASQISDSK